MNAREWTRRQYMRGFFKLEGVLCFGFIFSPPVSGGLLKGEPLLSFTWRFTFYGLEIACVNANEAMKKNIAKEILKLGVLFISLAVALGFFASIGIWAAVSFLKFFGIETL